ncbi:hypothetical protein [Nocardioides sp. URHA0020]|uniref:hypothetical protein n=1 Tax=Nocardioides sp. URHA0020 TaxID=1380392 RepID=UPI000B159E43|nr:hypothetical protein [Nocardioides sp. URHA0020]
MSSNNHAYNRELQQDARSWAAFTGSKYTAALRQMTSPFTQGLLGDRPSARHLISVLDQHPLVGTDDDGPSLSDNGFYADDPWRFNGQTDFVELVLVVEMLRMFTPTVAGQEPELSSYKLKHTAEQFLRPHCDYVSNGRLIWAAAALGLDLVDRGGSLNLSVGVSEREHHYLRRLTGSGQERPRGHQFRPPGLLHLQDALARCAAGGPLTGAWVRPASAQVGAPFHDWLTAQVGRPDPVGDIANDYTAGVRDSDHPIASTPGELLSLLYDVEPSPSFYDAAVAAIAEWMATSPEAAPIRTDLVTRDAHEVAGWGAGPGDIEVYRYRCPCGFGEIVEEHDNTPGFREHDVHIRCDRCREEWLFAAGLPVRGWGLVPAIGAGRAQAG